MASLMVEGTTQVVDPHLVGEEEMFVEAAAEVVEEEMELMEVVELWVTEVVVVKTAREEWEGENQVAVVANPREEGTPHWNYLSPYP